MWSVAAVESRPTEGAASPFESSPAPVRHVPEKSANKRVSHLAAETARHSVLGDTFGW